MPRYSILPIFLLPILLLSSCYKDSESYINTGDPDPPRITVETKVAGIVLNSDGRPVANADVYLGSAIRHSDENGFFSFDIDFLTLEEEGLKVQKSGYFSFHSSFYAREGQTMFINLPMTEVRTATLEDAGVKVRKNLLPGVEVVFEPNSLVDLNQVPLTDQFFLSNRWMQPDEIENYFRQLPALLYKDDIGISYVVIPRRVFMIKAGSQSGGALTVRDPVIISGLSDHTGLGERLYHISPSGVLTLIGQPNTTDQIPTTELGTFVIGEQLPMVRVSGQVAIDEFKAYPYATITFKDWRTGFTSSLRTLSDGSFTASVPTSSELEITIRDFCSEIMYESSQIIEEDLALNVQIDRSKSELFHYGGQMINCHYQSVSNGYIKCDFSGETNITPVNEDGSFNIIVPHCQQDLVSVEAFEFGAQQAGPNFKLSPSNRSRSNVIICPDDILSEAIISIGSDRMHFGQCLGRLHESNNVLTDMNFILEEDQQLELHNFSKRPKDNPAFWQSNSFFLNDRYRMIDLRGEPKIITFESNGLSYHEITFEGHFKEIQSGNTYDGSIQYVTLVK